MMQHIHTIIKKIASINAHTVGLLAVLVVAVSVTYSSAKIIHKNYLLEQEITKLTQQNALQQQINANQKLKNQYYTTDVYLDLAARKFFNKAAPGETVVLVPEEVALKYATPQPQEDNDNITHATSSATQNWKLWLDFLSGKPVQEPS